MKECKDIVINSSVSEGDLENNTKLILSFTYGAFDNDGNGEAAYNYTFVSNTAQGLLTMPTQLYIKSKNNKNIVIAVPSITENRINDLDELDRE